MFPPSNLSVEVLARDLRRWKGLAAVLLVALIGVGSFSAYLVHGLDEDYSRLFDRTLPLIDKLRFVGRGESDSYRAVVTSLVETDPAQVNKAVAETRVTLEHVDRSLAVLMTSDTLKEKPELLREIQTTSNDYLAAARDVLPRLAIGNTLRSERSKIEHLRTALDRALATNRRAIQFVEDRSQAISDRYTRIARSRATILVGIAGLPILFGMFILAAVVFVVLAMIWIFRGAGLDDGP